MAHLFPKHGIFHREHDLHTFVQVTRHPVRTAHIELLISTVAEIKNPGMLQEISDNGTHMDRLTDTRDTGL